MAKENTTCRTEGCSGRGLCPGIAILIAYLVGFGLTEFTNSTRLGFLVGVPLFIALVLGLPQKRTTHSESIDS